MLYLVKPPPGVTAYAYTGPDGEQHTAAFPGGSPAWVNEAVAYTLCRLMGAEILDRGDGPAANTPAKEPETAQEGEIAPEAAATTGNGKRKRKGF